MSNELNNLKVKALKAILEQTRKTIRAFNEYDNCDDGFAATLENIWMTEEEKLLGMRKLYKIIFDENAPRGTISLRKALGDIEFI